MPNRTWHNLAIVLRRVLRSPFVLSTLSVGILWALLLSHSIIGPAGFGVALLVIIIYALSKLRSEPYIRAAISEVRVQERRNEMEQRVFAIERLELESRLLMKSLAKLQSEIVAEVENSTVDEVSTGLGGTIDATNELLNRGLGMAQRRTDLQRYLSKTNQSIIEAKISELTAQVSAETDQQRKVELEASLTAKQQELNDYAAIKLSSDRILDQLGSIECAFSGLKTRLVRIKSTDIAEWTAASNELQTELGNLNASVNNLEISINEALSQHGNSSPSDIDR